MTTSFPSTSPAETALSANSAVPAALSGDLAALLGGSAPDASAAFASPTGPVDFMAMLGGETPVTAPAPTPAPPTPGTSPLTPSAAAPTAPAPTTVAPTVLASNTEVPSVARAIVATSPSGLPRPASRVAPTDTRGLTRTAPAPAASSDESEESPETIPAVTPAMPDRTTLEAVAALLAPVAALLAPPPAEAPLTPNLPSTSADAGEDAERTPSPVAVATTVPANRSQPIALSVTLPERAEPVAVAPAQPVVPVDETTIENEPNRLADVRRTAPPALAETVAAIELRPALPVRVVAPAASVVPASASARLQVEASVELPDGTVVALAAPSSPAVEAPAESNRRPVAAPLAARAEKSAASEVAISDVAVVTKNTAGKNFLTTEGQEVSLPEKKAGIGVAETRPTMLFTPHDTFSAVSPTVPAIVSIVPAQTQSVAAGSPEPLPQLVAASFAKRAVETVTSVVDAQAASKLQPVPSVQLKFKFGTEDLAVRVALRNGTVTTEFRTDSPELRAAITNEWKAVAAQPESALRFLEPVVSAATSPQTGTGSFAQQQQQSPGQSAAQQQQQQQSQQQARAAQEFFGSVGRSTPFQPREGGAAPTSAPVVLPTSVHLSAVA